MANYHQAELLKDARNARLAREATANDEPHAGHRMIVVAILILALIVVIAI